MFMFPRSTFFDGSFHAVLLTPYFIQRNNQKLLCQLCNLSFMLSYSSVIAPPTQSERAEFTGYLYIVNNVILTITNKIFV